MNQVTRDKLFEQQYIHSGNGGFCTDCGEGLEPYAKGGNEALFGKCPYNGEHSQSIEALKLDHILNMVGEIKQEYIDETKATILAWHTKQLKQAEHAAEVRGQIEALRAVRDSDVHLNHGTIELIGYMLQDLNKQKNRLKSPTVQ